MRKVILDADPGIDDAISIITAFGSSIDIIAVTTVNGNVNPKLGALNALILLESIGITDIPVIPGATRSIINRPLPARIKKRKEYQHGKDGLGNLGIHKSYKLELLRKKISAAPSYLNFTDDVARRYTNDEISIIATGPLTNIARMLMYKPSFADHIKEICIMGGAFRFERNKTIGSVTDYAEFNSYCDPEAAKIVFGSNLKAKIKIAGLNITTKRKCAFDAKFVDRLCKDRSLRSNLILSLLDFKLSFNPVFYLHDVFALVMLQRPSLFRFKRGNVDVILKGKMRGSTKFCENSLSGNILAAVDVNEEEFKNFLLNRLVF